MKPQCVTIQMKAIEQYFHVVFVNNQNDFLFLFLDNFALGSFKSDRATIDINNVLNCRPETCD